MSLSSLSHGANRQTEIKRCFFFVKRGRVARWVSKVPRERCKLPAATCLTRAFFLFCVGTSLDALKTTSNFFCIFFCEIRLLLPLVAQIWEKHLLLFLSPLILVVSLSLSLSLSLGDGENGFLVKEEERKKGKRASSSFFLGNFACGARCSVSHRLPLKKRRASKVREEEGRTTNGETPLESRDGRKEKKR